MTESNHFLKQIDQLDRSEINEKCHQSPGERYFTCCYRLESVTNRRSVSFVKGRCLRSGRQRLAETVPAGWGLPHSSSSSSSSSYFFYPVPLCPLVVINISIIAGLFFYGIVLFGSRLLGNEIVVWWWDWVQFWVKMSANLVRIRRDLLSSVLLMLVPSFGSWAECIMDDARDGQRRIPNQRWWNVVMAMVNDGGLLLAAAFIPVVVGSGTFGPTFQRWETTNSSRRGNVSVEGQQRYWICLKPRKWSRMCNTKSIQKGLEHRPRFIVKSYPDFLKEWNPINVLGATRLHNRKHL